MNIQELATTVENNIPVKVVILNNRYLGMVRQWQELFYQERYSSVDLGSTPDFVKLAEAYGAIGLRATKPSEVVSVLKEGLKAKRTVFMDFVTARYEKVFPMVPAGASINEMIFGEENKKEEKKLKAVK
jgi:acetolactate synthase-1/2/3 large subunit